MYHIAYGIVFGIYSLFTVIYVYVKIIIEVHLIALLKEKEHIHIT